ncbi:hypothetical protein MINTM008_23840 [Mycobacterium intracellulare]|nr:hypothetical protein MINTM005_22350 [Mycobacterium intracellulare]BCO67514.1 hypothetical protein MINTM007_21250 [Mycobacterium intracellulare]BCO73049.1 hypothetical protein MINTM008_23840 [Mycobacterium intracellulare]BCO78490.1 hypothetical protein MINTM009_22720 [Mycobacterium intracellulare]BCO94095.1 hypothetical protein MINTM016_20710 [Mycobacterium intracellulare]
MSNEDNVIDVEEVEIVDSDNLPAVRASTQSRMDTDPPPRWSEEWWAGVSPETRSHRCVAHKSNGERCLKLAIKGATVCRTHGGATRHVRRAARARLENAADLMARQLLGIALTAEGEAVKLAAIKDALDRAGLKPPAEVVLSQGEAKPYETVFDSIASGSRTESRRARGLPDTDDNSAGFEVGEHDTPAPPATAAETHSPPEPPPQPRPRQFGREDDEQPPARHVSGDAAVREARLANEQCGALPAQRAIESGHKRYRRP